MTKKDWKKINRKTIFTFSMCLANDQKYFVDDENILLQKIMTTDMLTKVVIWIKFQHCLSSLDIFGCIWLLAYFKVS